MKYKGFQEWAKDKSQEKRVKEEVVAKKKVSEGFADSPIIPQMMEQILLHLAKKYGKYTKIFKEVSVGTNNTSATEVNAKHILEYESNLVKGFGMLNAIFSDAKFVINLAGGLSDNKYYKFPLEIHYTYTDDQKLSGRYLGSFYINSTESTKAYWSNQTSNVSDYNFKIAIDKTQIVK